MKKIISCLLAASQIVTASGIALAEELEATFAKPVFLASPFKKNTPAGLEKKGFNEETANDAIILGARDDRFWSNGQAFTFAKAAKYGDVLEGKVNMTSQLTTPYAAVLTDVFTKIATVGIGAWFVSKWAPAYTNVQQIASGNANAAANASASSDAAGYGYGGQGGNGYGGTGGTGYGGTGYGGKGGNNYGDNILINGRSSPHQCNYGC